MSQNRTDLTAPPDLTHERRTGPVRLQRPLYQDLLPPCNHACPAGENIQAWLSLATEGRFREAWDVIVRDNPLPAIHGRVCYHPCESNCNRKEFDEPISIHAIERFLGDSALAEGWTPEITAPASGKRILVIGAGPSGISAAHHLALLGHQVEIRDAAPQAGGMMRYGIPAYRLPRDILDGEVARLQRLGVQITLDHRVTDLTREMRDGNFDAVFVAVGAHLGKKTEIPARDAGKILDAVTFLRDVEAGNAPSLGRRVAVYGGGNTAMDAARVAMRLGSEPLIIYRRDRAHMPAHEMEADEAIEEGVNIHWLRTIKSIEASTLTVEKMEIDETGRPRPTGELETIEADDLILALGQDTDTGFLRRVPDVEFKEDGTVVVDANMQTGHPGIFAGGDMVPSERTVTIAVGHGKKAARNIDAFLRDTTYAKPSPPPLASYEKLRLWFYAAVKQRNQPQIDLTARKDGFGEVVGGLSVDEARYEAQRCFSCGNCFECDACYGACPEDAIEKLGKGSRYRFDFDKCTGCGVCFEQCPCHAISLIPERSEP
ncbi:MAG TPA: NAD(P)-binding protein [Fimbriimonadaceae bacterium]|nr:NAD(P)-binding protein [Fimbriimonadaceae bacterium]